MTILERVGSRFGEDNFEEAHTALTREEYLEKWELDLSEDDQMDLINQNEYYFRFISHPTQKVKDEVLKRDGNLIHLIPNPTKEEQLLAVEYPDAIEGIQKPCLKAQMYVLRLHPDYIDRIRYPHPEALKYAEEKGFIHPKLSRDEQFQVLMENEAVGFQYMREPTAAVIDSAIWKRPGNILFISNPTEEQWLKALSLCWERRDEGERIEYLLAYAPGTEKIRTWVKMTLEV